MRYGIFGGTFDPPHIGHQILAAEACHQLGLDRILWVLTPYPPHKSGRIITALDRRLAMLRSIVAGDPTFELSSIDINRPAPHYAADSMAILRENDPSEVFIYLMGADSLDELQTWHEPERFLSLCDGLGVMQRPGSEIDLDKLDYRLPGIRSKVQLIQAPLLEVSSTQIRQRVRQGRPYRYYLSEGVYQIVRDHWLYLPA
jgi:nicotinate-nucleotide adenylyltransferase